MALTADRWNGSAHVEVRKITYVEKPISGLAGITLTITEPEQVRDLLIALYDGGKHLTWERLNGVYNALVVALKSQGFDAETLIKEGQQK